MSGNTVQIYVNFGIPGIQNTWITLPQDASVEELWTNIFKCNGGNSEHQSVIYEGKQITAKQSKEKTHLSYYHVQDRAELFVVFQLPAGGRVIKRFAPDVERTDAPDMITWDDDPTIERAKMPCGHAIGADSLTAYCRSLLSSGKFRFQCPYKFQDNQRYCGQYWEYHVVQKCGVLSSDEKKEFETKISQNYMRKAMGIQECPQCTVFCMRQNPKDKRVVCLACKKDKKNYEFCWCCLGEWKTPGTSNCGNLACTGKDPRLKMLKEAELKEIVGLKDCPSVRACPKCGMLIQHTKECKHMVCICGQQFCFICLKKATSGGSYGCGSFDSHCTIAPVQTRIPGDGNYEDEDNNKEDDIQRLNSNSRSACTIS